jgi:hypothetical protein
MIFYAVFSAYVEGYVTYGRLIIVSVLRHLCSLALCNEVPLRVSQLLYDISARYMKLRAPLALSDMRTHLNLKIYPAGS